MPVIANRPTNSITPSAPPTDAGETRLRLHPRDDVPGTVDGAWWPRSLDLSAELPSLVAAVVASGFDVRRVVYNLTGWWPAPRRLTLPDRVVKLSGYRTQSPDHLSLVDSSSWARLDLVVIPPHEDVCLAEQVLARAGGPVVGTDSLPE